MEEDEMTYHASIDGGEGGETDFRARSIDDALARAIEWAEDGDWPDQGCTITVTVWREDGDGNTLEWEREWVRIPSCVLERDECSRRLAQSLLCHIGHWCEDETKLEDRDYTWDELKRIAEESQVTLYSADEYYDDDQRDDRHCYVGAVAVAPYGSLMEILESGEIKEWSAW